MWTDALRTVKERNASDPEGLAPGAAVSHWEPSSGISGFFRVRYRAISGLAGGDMRARHSVHPLLLEPTYWRNRLQGLDLEHTCPLITPRPDLSQAGTDVVEFRLKAHDGATEGEPQFDVEVIRRGCAEFLLREPRGRRLEDRVLDVVRVCHLAYRTEGVDRLQVTFSCPGAERAPDEFLIAEQLFEGRFV